MTRHEIGALVASGFDQNHYLASYPDVRTAGLAPLDHYLSSGWREGRFPSAHFAACASLFDLAGLRALGVDPFALFLLVRATSAPLLDAESAAARDADPLACTRIQGQLRYAATLMGAVDWSGCAVETLHDSPYRGLATRLRLALKAFVGRPLVLLPDRNWPGAAAIAQALDQRHVAFVHFGEPASQDRWRGSLSNLAGLPPVQDDDAVAIAIHLLVDVLRGVVPPVIIDLGSRALRTALLQRPAAPAWHGIRIVAFVDAADDLPSLDGIDAITRVDRNDARAPVDPVACVREQLREIALP